MKEYQGASENQRLQMETRYGKKQLQMLVENTMSENWINVNSQHCPRCNAAIEVCISFMIICMNYFSSSCYIILCIRNPMVAIKWHVGSVIHIFAGYAGKN